MLHDGASSAATAPQGGVTTPRPLPIVSNATGSKLHVDAHLDVDLSYRALHVFA
jgi:hypothetical protein